MLARRCVHMLPTPLLRPLHGQGPHWRFIHSSIHHILCHSSLTSSAHRCKVKSLNTHCVQAFSKDLASPASLSQQYSASYGKSKNVSVDQDKRDHTETIVALSSGSGRSAVAVIRISGPQADVILKLMLASNSSLPSPRKASVRSIHNPRTGELLDRALTLRFPGPSSFTGEDIVEIHGHGGPAVVKSLVSAILDTSKARLAEAGEYTRRAFMAGKMDLTEVEGLADLLAAETEAQHRQALRQTTGRQRKQYEAWRKTLINCLAHVEAVLDFGDDNDIESNVADEIFPIAMGLRKELEYHLAEGKRGEFLRTGFKVALVGPPNAGKSTILNLLAGRDAAIVSSIPGTTRDTLEVALEIAGHKVLLTDTAGLRQTNDEIEAEGVIRAKQAAESSDIVIAVLDFSSNDVDPEIKELLDTESQEPSSNGIESNGGTRMELSQGWSQGFDDSSEPVDKFQSQLGQQKPVIIVYNKVDLQSKSSKSAIGGEREGMESWPTVEMIANKGTGVEKLLEAIEKSVTDVAGSSENSEGYLITRLRHRQHVEECVAALNGYENVHNELDLASEELRFAAKSLGKITGSIDTDDILNAVFSEFCIGK